jgi:hypothetical protein
MERYFNFLKIKNYNIIGSYDNPERKFYGDIDLDENLSMTPTEFVKKMKEKILKIRKNNEIFFIDFKAGNLNGKSIKWTQSEIIDGYRYIDNRRINLASTVIDGSIIKLDVIVINDDFMMPMSINYYMNENKPSATKLKGDIFLYAQKLKEEGDLINYVKKMRLFYTLEGDKKKEKKMNDILNSDLGLIYKYIGFLENILLLLNSDNSGYSLDNIRKIFNSIYRELPKRTRHYMLPLNHILNKQSLIETIPKVIKSLEDYIKENINLK